MPSDEIIEKVQRATVTLINKGGRGVLVPNNMILTAAHCILYNTEGQMALGEYFLEDVLTITGKIKVTPIAVEPVSDIAVLGQIDGQESPEDMSTYNDFSKGIIPIPLCFDDYIIREPFPVHVYTHKGKWIKGEAMLCTKNGEQLWVDFSEQIEPGSSGSPIVNDAGKLVGIVSHSSFNEGQSNSDGLAPRPHLVLPVWICNRISEDQENYCSD